MPKARSAAIEIRAGAGGQSAYVGKTRIRVADIARMYSLIQDEIIVSRILKAHPHLTLPQLVAAIDYWRSHQTEVEGEVKEEESILEGLSAAAR